eukprot:TRINITY_DN6526_c0_g1_i1.p1 TRINITY_DN6526_c0_g1~~TRINITY_DN6526_c0_g1_i1.p1  ORF type:complete len:104 (-),score=29.80 TRINITY_DN6526_c0_g1_i1:48-359(-)
MSHVDIVQKYMDARMGQKHEEVVNYVTDDVVLISAKDGTHSGKEAFLKYVKNTPPTGTWEKPQEAGSQVTVAGKVRFLMMDWNVKSYFDFSNDKISKIEIKRE